MATLSKEERARLAKDALSLMLEISADIEVTEEELAAMSLDELVAFLAQHGVEIDPRNVREDLRASMRAEVRALDKGLPLDPNAKDEIGAKASKALVRASENTARSTVSGMHNSAVHGSDERKWDEQFYVWVSVGEGVCPSCFSLHGTVLLLDAWESIGKPGDGATYCGDHCRCRLFPCSADPRQEGDRSEEMRDVVKEGDTLTPGQLRRPRGY